VIVQHRVGISTHRFLDLDMLCLRLESDSPKRKVTRDTLSIGFVLLNYP
jgi:hypothetical protein